MSAARDFLEPEPRRLDGANRPALFWIVLALCALALTAVVPFWIPLVLAAWSAVLAQPLHRACMKRLHKRSWAAALITVLLVVAVLTPLLVATLSLSAAAIELGHRFSAAPSALEAVRSLAQSHGAAAPTLKAPEPQQIVDWLKQHGAGAWAVARATFGAATVLVLAVVVFVSAFYSFLLQGAELHEWLLRHSPLERGQFHRLSSVFVEVGRGLLIGVGLTALVQGATAAVGYWLCGVSQPWVLGLVTMLASLIPSLGSALVWAPVTASLALSGRPGAAAAMLAIGCVVSLVDNLLRPLFTRYGELRMNGLLLFIAMLGGMSIFGAGGLLLGPLVVRLAREGLVMLREARPGVFPG